MKSCRVVFPRARSSLPVNPTTSIVLINPNSTKARRLPLSLHWYASTLSSSADGADDSPALTILQSYPALFPCFSASVPASSLARLGALPHVLSVLPDRRCPLTTTRSLHFLSISSPSSSPLLSVAAIWFLSSACNKKLIGSRFFCKGYEATNGKMNETTESRSPLDTDGHGTHTASIAAGRYVPDTSTMGYASGVAAGMAPKARVAAFQVCWNSGCYDSDIFSAFNSAVADGVDMISLSVRGVVVPYYLDAIAITGRDGRGSFRLGILW